MSFLNRDKNELNFKVVYCGPGMGGKTTNLQHIYKKTSNDKNGISSFNNDRTLFFDFLPLDIGPYQGLQSRLHLYSIPGQAFYVLGRKVILKGVDGIVFVADSQLERMDANRQSLADLKKELQSLEYDFQKIPIVFQWNKEDLPNTISRKELHYQLNKDSAPEFSASAIEGKGVLETLNSISRLVMVRGIQ